MRTIGIGDTVYWARVHHETGIYDLCELHIRSVYPDMFVGVDKDTKRAFVLSFDECDETVFDNRNDALRVVQKAEEMKKDFSIDNSDE